MRSSSRRRPGSIFGFLLFLAPFIVHAATEPRTGFIDCGATQIRARAECHGNSGYCVTETLSFSRRAGRAIVPVHADRTTFSVDGAKVHALEYRAAAWACLPGRFGGHYLVVAMERANGAACGDCEYSRLYDLNGRLIATDRDADGRGLMRKVLGEPRAYPFAAVYAVIK